MLEVLPQLVAKDGLRAMRAAIAEPTRYAIERASREVLSSHRVGAP